MSDESDREILRRYGYDPDDPVPRDQDGQRIIPDKLLRRLARTTWIPETEISQGAYVHRHDESDPVTEMELKVLFLLSHGLTRTQTAETLVKDLETIKSQMKTASYRLRAKTVAHACCQAIRRGLIP
jgi:DNA-binding NarL/FixJ family response regulator